MSTTYTKGKLGITDDNGNTNIIYPITTASAVKIEANDEIGKDTTLDKLLKEKDEEIESLLGRIKKLEDRVAEFKGVTVTYED